MPVETAYFIAAYFANTVFLKGTKEMENLNA
jgi:hypothetical protein